LDGGADGLLFYRAILEHYAPMVRPGGVIVLEIGYDQGDDLRRLAEQHTPHASFELIRDLGGRDRVVVLHIPV
jgi:release factor glutamine methyltransferase